MHFPKIHPTYDTALAAALDAHINNKTKPLGSLGILESVAKTIGLIQQRRSPN